MPLLELRSITKDFPGVRALDGVSFAVEAGEIHALCGENGAGKSTLTKILSGFHPAGTFEGEILLEGRPIRFRGLRDAEALGIALIAQELAIVPGLSVLENLMLGREPTRGGLIRWDAARATAEAALARVGLDVDADRRAGDLGVGRQQLVEIAKALAKNARVLVLDEPTAALPDADVDRLFALLADLRAAGTAVVYISHRLEEVFRIADRVTVLRDGRSVGTAPAAETTAEEVIARMVGREVKRTYPRPPAPAGDEALAVEGWSVNDPLSWGREVVSGVSFTLRRGEVLGLAGLVGSGRTALLASLFGAGRGAVAGRLRLGGGAWRAPFGSPAEAAAAGLALVSEDRKRYGLVLGQGTGENLTLAVLRRFVRGGLLDHDARERAAAGQVEALRIRTPGLDAPVRTLSGGNQQKVVVGKWLLAGPRVLLLDEPTRGVDVGARAELYEILHDLSARGLAILLVSSDLPEVLGLSHRVLVLAEGRRAALLEHDEATPEAVMTAATTGAREGADA